MWNEHGNVAQVEGGYMVECWKVEHSWWWYRGITTPICNWRQVVTCVIYRSSPRSKVKVHASLWGVALLLYACVTADCRGSKTRNHPGFGIFFGVIPRFCSTPAVQNLGLTRKYTMPVSQSACIAWLFSILQKTIDVQILHIHYIHLARCAENVEFVDCWKANVEW